MTVVRHDEEDTRSREFSVLPVKKPTPDEILRLAASVYEGLSESDIAEIEEMARHAPFSERKPT